MGFRSFGTVMALCIGMWSPGARAERSVILAYGGEALPEGGEALTALMGEVLRADDEEIVDGFAEAGLALEEGGVPAQALLPFARARQLFEEGWRSYLEVRPGFAAARLAEARTVSLAVAHLDGGTELLAEVSLRLGVAKLDLERNAEAADDFRLSHSLQPERAVTDAEFKPEVVQAYATAISASRASQARPLRVQPAGAALSLDGLASAAGTVTMEDGLHLLSVRAPGYRAQSQLVSVSPGGDAPILIEMRLDPQASLVLEGRGALALGVAESEARDAVGAVLLYSASDTMLLVASAWRRGQPALLGQRCAGLPAQCTPVSEIGYPEGGRRVAAEELWRQLAAAPLRFPPTLQADARVVAGEKAPGEEGPGTHRAFWKNRWLWVGVAAASVVGGAVYLLAGDDEIKPLFSGDRCGFGGCE